MRVGARGKHTGCRIACHGHPAGCPLKRLRHCAATRSPMFKAMEQLLALFTARLCPLPRPHVLTQCVAAHGHTIWHAGHPAHPHTRRANVLPCKRVAGSREKRKLVNLACAVEDKPRRARCTTTRNWNMARQVSLLHTRLSCLCARQGHASCPTRSWRNFAPRRAQGGAAPAGGPFVRCAQLTTRSAASDTDRYYASCRNFPRRSWWGCGCARARVFWGRFRPDFTCDSGA